MRGWIAKDGSLQLVERPDEAPARGEVAIRVSAAGINRADLAQKAGFYPPPPGASEVLGLECSGVIESVGEGVEDLAVGQQVCALLSGGGYADRVLCPAPQVVPVPQGMGLVVAAGLPEVFATAWLNLFMEGQLRAGEKVLVHAGGSGVGTAAIQLCRAFDHPCFATAGSDAKIERCLKLGAAAGAVRGQQDWVEAVRVWAEQGVDLVLDPVGADYLAGNLQVMAVGGRLLLIALMGGSKAEVNLGLVLMKRLRLLGSTLRARSVAYKGRVMAELRAKVWPLLESGDIVPVIDRVLPWGEVEAAHSYMSDNSNFGKILLEFPSA